MTEINDEVQRSEEGEEFFSGDTSWSAKIDGAPPGVSVEIGTPSAKFNAFNSRPFGETLKISGLTFESIDGTITELERLKDDLAFEFDLKYGLPFALRRRPSPPLFRRRGISRENSPAPCWPKNSYSTDPLSLYWYARSAQGLPLLEFLAYYQVLEYYFPHHYRRELLGAVREELKDPRFRFDSDENLARILQIASGGSGSRGSEEDQLRATIRGAATKDSVLDLIRDDERLLLNLTGKKTLNGVPQLNLEDRGSDIRDQLSRRVYAIRCRIVHSKVDGGAREAAPLLPFSDEADRLGADIEILQFLAQKAIIAGASARAL